MRFTNNKQTYFVTLENEGARQSAVTAYKKYGEVVHKDMNDLHLKPSDAMGRSKWREMIRGYRRDRSSDSHASK